jgi:hypothetical protein
VNRRSLLGLIAAALCPSPPPGFPKLERPKPRAVVEAKPVTLESVFAQHSEAIDAEIYKRELKRSPWMDLIPKDNFTGAVSIRKA